jgi:hypothetical protein
VDKLLDVTATWKTFESELEAAIHLESAPRLRVGDLGEPDTLAIVTKDIPSIYYFYVNTGKDWQSVHNINK